MANLNITLAVDTAKKTCSQSGTPSIRETVNFVISGLSGTSAANLRLFITHNGELMASCDSLSVGAGGYVAQTDLGTDALIELFGAKKFRTERKLRVVVQDIVQGVDFLNDYVKMIDNPYDSSAAAPETVDKIGS